MSNIHTISDLNRDRRGYNYFNMSQYDQERGTSSSPAISFGYPGGPKGTFMQFFLPNFGFKTFVFVATTLQIVIFLITELISFIVQGNNSRDVAFNCVLYKFGAKYTPAIVVLHEIHRLFMPILLHGGFMHILSNMFGQIFIGFNLEKAYGMKKFVFLYLVSGIGGNMLSAVNRTESLAIGASTSLLGIMALQTAYMLQNYHNMGPNREVRLVFWLFILASNLGTAGEDSNVDNDGHLGGFLVGALLAVMISERPSDPTFYKKQRLAGLVVVVFFVVCGIILATKKGLEWGVLRYASCSRFF